MIKSEITTEIRRIFADEPAKSAFLLDWISAYEDEDLPDCLQDADSIDYRSFDGIEMGCDGEHSGSGGAVGDFGDGEVVDGLFFCRSCVEKRRRDKAFDALVDSVEKAVVECGWEICDTVFALTGTRYLIISKDRNGGDDDSDDDPLELKIRISDHDQVYDADFSIDPYNYTVEQLKNFLCRKGDPANAVL